MFFSEKLCYVVLNTIILRQRVRIITETFRLHCAEKNLTSMYFKVFL